MTKNAIRLLFLQLSFLLGAWSASPWSRPSVLQTRGGDNDDSRKALVGTKSNPLVAAAPLIVAAVCENGVAVVAIHQNADDDDDNWLENFRGPARIHPIDSQGTALLCAGWRTDADWLAAKCRSIAAEEVESLGCPPSSQVLAKEAALWMAQCAASDRVRALSVVGLLACSNRCLWLIDATGSYQVRAHAVGHGAMTINGHLRKLNFGSLTAREGLETLRQLLIQPKPLSEGGNWEPLPNKTRVELAVIDSETKQLQRIRQSFLVDEVVDT